MNSAYVLNTDEWLKIISVFLGALWILIGAFIYVWKDDRRRLDRKIDRDEFFRYREDLKNDLEIIRRDLARILDLIVKKVAGGA